MKRLSKFLADLVIIITCAISIASLWNDKTNIVIIPAFIIGLKVAEMLFTLILEEETYKQD